MKITKHCCLAPKELKKDRKHWSKTSADPSSLTNGLRQFEPEQKRNLFLNPVKSPGFGHSSYCGQYILFSFVKGLLHKWVVLSEGFNSKIYVRLAKKFSKSLAIQGSGFNCKHHNLFNSQHRRITTFAGDAQHLHFAIILTCDIAKIEEFAQKDFFSWMTIW